MMGSIFGNIPIVRDIPIVGDVLRGPAKPDISPATNANAGYLRDADWLEAERRRVRQGGGVQVNPTYIDPLRKQQDEALGLVRSAALGTAPSAAEIAGQTMANRAAAQQFGMASALGGRSPGGALNAALNGAAGIQGQNIADTTALRAREMADARTQLVTGLGGVRQQEQGLGTTNAQLNIDQQKMLLAAKLQELGYSADMIKAIIGANTSGAASENAYTGGILGAAGQAGGLALGKG